MKYEFLPVPFNRIESKALTQHAGNKLQKGFVLIYAVALLLWLVL